MIALAFLLAGLATSVTTAQAPPIAIVDWYGMQEVSRPKLQQALAIEPGDPLPEQPAEAEARLEAVPGVADARLSAVCCEGGGTILYVGIREAGQTALSFGAAPSGAARLPEEVKEAGAAFEKALMAAVQRGEVGEDDSLGHALVHDPAARAIQESFIDLADRYRDQLREVLQDAADAEQRALAAQVLAYATDKPAVVPDLVHALKDPDPGVRNNAMRALALMGKYARRAPEAGIHVPLRPFIDLLSSIIWTDRNKASFALLSLAGPDDAEALATLRKEALQPLVEMARWQSPGHALPGLVLLGRIAGMSDPEIFAAFQSGEREAVIEAALEGTASPDSAR